MVAPTPNINHSLKGLLWMHLLTAVHDVLLWKSIAMPVKVGGWIIVRRPEKPK